MTTQITYQSRETENGSTYNSIEMTANNKTVSIVSVSGKSNYVHVIYKNAAHKAYRGWGKEFPTFADALNNYKDASIRNMIIVAESMQNQAN